MAQGAATGGQEVGLYCNHVVVAMERVKGTGSNHAVVAMENVKETGRRGRG